MPELLEPPAPVSSGDSDSDALKSAFNTALKAGAGVDDAAANDDAPDPGATPGLIAKPADSKPPEKKEAAGDSIVPSQFTEKPKAKEADAAPADEIPANAGAKQLREALARRDAKLKELQAERDALRLKAEAAPVGASKEQEDAYKAATDRAAKLEQELERAAYDRSPKFQRFGAEETAEITSAKSYLEGTEINPSVLELAARTTGQSRLKLLRDAGMDAETIAAVGPHLARADAIRRERDASLENWKAGAAADQQAQQTRATQEEAQRRQQEETVFKTVGEQMRTKLEAFQKVEGHEKWNAMVEQNEKDAADFFAGKKSLPELAELAYLGVSSRTTKVMNDELRRQLNVANEELGRLRAAQPGTGKAADPKAGQATAPVNDTDHYKQSFRAAQERVGSGGVLAST